VTVGWPRRRRWPDSGKDAGDQRCFRRSCRRASDLDTMHIVGASRCIAGMPLGGVTGVVHARGVRDVRSLFTDKRVRVRRPLSPRELVALWIVCLSRRFGSTFMLLPGCRDTAPPSALCHPDATQTEVPPPPYHPPGGGGVVSGL
jgi:hypothetical protein